jgi:hypothetical protein
VKWLKRYATSCLIAMFVLAALDGYHRPGEDMRVGAIITVSAVWPIIAAIVVGSSVGEAAHDMKQEKAG